MNAIVEQINSGGYAFVEFAASMLIQASVLIVLLFLADLVLRRRVRAVFRYWTWLLVLVKLVLPTSLSGPFSIGYWLGDKLEYADVGRGAYEPRARGPMMPALPYIDSSNVPPAIYPPATSPAPGEVDVSTAQSIAAPAVPPAQIEWQGIVLLLWLAVVIAMALLLAQRAIFVHGLVAQAREASRPMYDALADCRGNMKVGAKVGLKVSPNAASPAVCGLLRPAILVPQNLASALDTTDLRIVLLHELAHVKRGDLWVNLAQTLLQIVYFYNPLLWLANAVIRRAREQAVDEAVLVAMGEKARRYPQTLVSVAKLAFKRPALSLRLIGVVESENALTARIKRILSRPIPKSAKLGILGLAVIVMTAAILLPMAKAQPYTDRARQVMALAEQEARRLKHEYIGTEHILLALSRQDEGVGGQVLQKLGIRTETVEGELAKLVKAGSRPVTKARLPQTPRARSAIDYAEQEAKALDHDYIGTEHILLGLMRETDGLAAQIVTNLGVSYEVVREEVLGFVKPGANASLDDAGERDQRETPSTSAYEKAEGSRNLKIKVGPSTFKVNMVVRWDGGGNPRFEDGLGNEPREIDLKTPDYSKQAAWMDIANIYISPDSARYDVLELRVFDHKTRELLSPKGRIGIGCDVKNSIVQLRSIGAPLPESVDVWVRLLHNPEQDSVWRLDAKAGASAQLNREQISLRTIKDGLWSHSTKQPAGGKPGQIQWTKRHEDSDVCMAVFDFSNVKRRFWGKDEKYQICAVGVDGKRYVPDFPHFIGVVSGATEIIRFGLPAEKVSRFEIRPFHGRDRFYFDNVKLPGIGQRTFDPPPIVTARVTGTRTEFTSSILHPIQVKVRVLPGIAAASAQSGSGTLAARVYPIHEPKNLDTQTTVIYDFHGIQLNRCFLCYLDHQGNRVSPRPTIDISQGAPARQFTGFETVPIPIDKIERVVLSLVDDDPRPTSVAGSTDKTDAAQPRYSATLPNGVTVELVGVCEHPSEGKQWWGVGGRLVPEPYQRLNYNERSADNKLYEVAYRLFGCDDILSTIYSNSEITGHISLYPLDQKTEKLNIPDAANAYGAILLVKPDAQFIQLEMGIGRDSDWKTLCTQASPVDKTGTGGPGVVFQPAIEKDGKTHITIAHQIKDRQIRVIAVDHSGQIHKSEGFLNTISGELGSCQVRFNLPADQIKEIQFQTQKFERVTFKNIALQPSFKTNVQTEVETPDEKAGVVWGEVVGGLRAAAEFVPEKESYTLGEGVEVRFHIQNVGSEDAQFASESTRQDWATVKDSDGNDVKVDRRWHSGTVATIRHIIKPGQILTLKTSGLGFGDFDDPAVVVERKGPWIGSVVRCGPGQYSISYPVNRDLETGVRKVTVTERQQVDPRRFELVLDRQSMLQAVNELMQKYRVRICFEEIGSESGAQQDQLSGAFSGPTIPELLDKLTAAGPYKWEKFYRTYVVYPKEGSVLSFFVKTDISDSPLEDVAKAILDQDPNGKNIEIEAAYKGKMRDHLWISKSSAMYALAKATESAGYNDVVWSVAEDQGRRILSLHKLGQAGQRAVKVESSQAASLPNNLAGSQGNTDEVKYQGRTIAEWMSQWDTRVSDDIDAATNALIKIGRPAVPRMIEEINKRSNYGWHAVGVLTKMGPEAEEAIPWLIEAALDKDLRFGDGRQSTTAYRGSVLYSLSRMTWARDRVIPVLQKVAEDSEEVAGVRRQVILALRDVGKGAMPILQKLTETEEHSVRDAAHGAIGQLLEKEEGLSKDDYYTPLIERDPFDPSVLQYLGNAKGIVNYGRPHPLTQNIKKLYRERLAKQTDPQLAWRLASIIQNGLKNTELMWAAPADGSKVRWPREDPTENYTTLAEVLQLGFDHAESGSQLQRQFGISLAKLRLLQGDWDRMNAMLKELGQEQIPKESRQWLHAPPVDWEEGVGSQWKIADESMRSGNCGLEFRIEKDGKGLQGVHFLVKRAPESTNVIQTGISIDTLFFEPYPLKGFSSFGYKAADRPMTRYAVSDESGIVRFEKLPNIPIKIEVLVPTSNFPEAVSNWDLWMEVEPGKYKIAKKYGAGAVNTQEPPAVAKLKEGQKVHYPNLVVRVEGEVAWGEAVEGEGRSVVRANVLDHQGRPVEGATVELQLFAGGDVGDQDKYSIRRAMTDANGFYVFEDIRAISGHIGRAFTSEDDSGGGVPFGLGFRFEIEPGKDYDITLGGKGRPVTGRLVPASGNNGDIDWSKAWVGFELRTAPMGMIELDSQRRTAMTNVEGGDFYDKRPVKINPDGTFRIENVRAGRYMLRVKIPEEPKRDGFNLFRDVRIPLMPNGTTEKPFNLGSLAVSHGSHTAPRHIDNLFLGSLVFDRDIAVELVAGNEEQPDVVAAKGIRFAKNGESVTAALNVEWKSLVVDKWRARLALLGGNGSHLAWDDAFIETSKTIEKYPQLVEETLSFSFSPEPDLSRISRFTITIQPLDEVLAGPVQVEGERPDNESNLVWGEEVDGLQLGLSYDSQERPYYQGEIVSFEVHVRNNGDKAVDLAYVELFHWCPYVRDVRDTNDATFIVNVHLTGGDASAREEHISLGPGDRQSLGKVVLQIGPVPKGARRAEYSADFEPGGYVVTQTGRFRGIVYDSWRGELTTGELPLAVLPAQTSIGPPRKEENDGSEAERNRLLKKKPAISEVGDAMTAISAIIERLRSAEYVRSGKGSALVVEVESCSSEQSSPTAERIVDFRFKGNLTRSDAFSSDKGKRGHFIHSWATGPMSSVWSDGRDDATVQGEPFSDFHCQVGYDFHPETFLRYQHFHLAELLERMIGQPDVVLEVAKEPKDMMLIVGQAKDEISEQRIIISLIDGADGVRLASWESTSKDLTDNGTDTSLGRLQLDWKKYSGVWYISGAISEGTGVHDGLRSERRTTVTIRDFTPNVEIEEKEFTLGGLDIRSGATVHDAVLGTTYKYAGAKDDSAERLRRLGTALLMYSNDYDDKFPDTIEEAKQFLNANDLKWLVENVQYLGKGKSVNDDPQMPLAYDRTMLDTEQARGTNVLFVSGIVSFRTGEQLEKLGIAIPLSLSWGDDVNGLRAAIEFEPEKQTYSILQKIDVHFHIQNISDKPIQFISESYRWEPLKIEDANGNRQGVRENVYSGLPPITRHYLEPGGEVVLRGLPLSIAQDEQQLESLGGPYGTDFKAKPGVYFVRSRLTIRSVISSSLPARQDDWTGQLETGRHKLVVAVDPNSGNRPR